MNKNGFLLRRSEFNPKDIDTKKSTSIGDGLKYI